MIELNPFIKANKDKLKAFIDKISTREGKDEEPTKIDLPLELELLKEHFNKNKAKILLPDAPVSIQTLYDTLDILNKIHTEKEEEELIAHKKAVSSPRKSTKA